MRILVRAPNWLGDLVMSLGFFDALRTCFPGADTHVIVRDTVAQLVPGFPGRLTVHPYSRTAHPGLRGLWSFSRAVAASGPFDRFYCLPNSLGSAVMGVLSGSTVRVGYHGQWRRFLLSHSAPRPRGCHRVEEYTGLLSLTGDRAVPPASVRLVVDTRRAGEAPAWPASRPVFVVNVHAAAPSRRLSLHRWQMIGRALLEQWDCQIILIGAATDAGRTRELATGLDGDRRVTDLSGRTTLPQLAAVMQAADVVISTDSGPAHLANAVGTPTVVLFGAGNEQNTAPWDTGHVALLRVDGLECAPCVSNECRLGDQRCLEQIEVPRVVEAVRRLLGERPKR